MENMVLGGLFDVLKAFLVGGLLCVIAQLLIDYTKLTPARILTLYVVVGVILSATGIYKYLWNFAGAGASVPLIGFGNALAVGAKKAALENGFIGAISGGIASTATGVSATIILSVIAAALYKPKDKV